MALAELQEEVVEMVRQEQESQPSARGPSTSARGGALFAAAPTAGDGLSFFRRLQGRVHISKCGDTGWQAQPGQCSDSHRQLVGG